MKKGAQNYIGIIFGAANKLAQCTSLRGALNGTAYKSVWEENESSRPDPEGSTSHVRESYISHLSPCLMALVIKPSRAFSCLG